jgi:hypothetical protein
MKKNNSADFTQFELFDETVTVFEVEPVDVKDVKVISPLGVPVAAADSRT